MSRAPRPWFDAPQAVEQPRPEGEGRTPLVPTPPALPPRGEAVKDAKRRWKRRRAGRAVLDGREHGGRNQTREVEMLHALARAINATASKYTFVTDIIVESGNGTDHEKCSIQLNCGESYLVRFHVSVDKVGKHVTLYDHDLDQMFA